MRRFSLGLLVAVLVGLGLLYSSVFVLNEREQALVLRFGEIRRVIRQPGVYFKVPTNLVETVQIIDDRILPMEIDDILVQVRDGRRYVVDAFVALRIVDPQLFRENVSGSLDIAEQNLRSRLDAALRRVYGQRTFEAALSEQRQQMMREVAEQLRPEAANFGIGIEDVRIRRTELLPEVSQQTFERMKAERQAEAAQLRALGTQEQLRIQAEADREARITVAEASRDSEVLRGEGDAERNRIFADAFQRDPEFFEFYRSMRAYETAIGNDTTMVLSPDSEFFRYFRNAEGPAGTVRTATPAAPSGGAANGGAAAAPAPAGEAGSVVVVEPSTATPSAEAGGTAADGGAAAPAPQGAPAAATTTSPAGPADGPAATDADNATPLPAAGTTGGDAPDGVTVQ